MCTVVGHFLIIFIVLIMIFIVMANGNGCPPACKIQEARTGNYVLIWSGLSYHYLRVQIFSKNLIVHCAKGFA